MTRRRRGIGLGGWMRRRRQRSPAADLVELCENLRLEGWEHLTGEGGVVVVTPGDPSARRAPWHIVARAIAAWAGPLALLDPGEPVDRDLIESLGLGGPVGEVEARGHLAAGRKVLVLSTGSRNASPAATVLDGGEHRTLAGSLGRTATGHDQLTIRPLPAGGSHS